MSALISRDVSYAHDGTRMRGMLVTPVSDRPLPAVLLLHDAFGLNDDTIAIARRVASLGYAVFAADVWGDRQTPRGEDEIGPLIGAMAGDRPRWHARIDAAHEAAAAQTEIDAGAIVALGYCFGGAGALEHLRVGAELRGVISIHGGLDLLKGGWNAAHPGASVLVATGAADPMATPAQREALTAELSGTGIDWELDLYSDTVHAFTNPKSAHSPDPAVIAYNPRSAARAWAATTRFLAETFGEQEPQR